MPSHETHMVVKQLPVFTTLLHDHQNINSNLIELIDWCQRSSPEGLKQSTNLDAWRTEYLTQDDTDDFNFLIEIILEFIRSVNVDYFNDNQTRYECFNFWAMKYTEGDCAYKHNHYPADFSCVYYISVTDKSSPIVFENKLKIQPEDGMLVLFPGCINHNVFPTKDKRIAFSANFNKLNV